MIILKQKYITNLKPEDVIEWLNDKDNERWGILKQRKYLTNFTETSFRIKRNRYTQFGKFEPSQVIGIMEFDGNKTTIDIKFQPSKITIIRLTLLFILILILNIGFKSNVIEILVIAIVFSIFSLIFLISSNYSARNWIEKELDISRLFN